MHDLLFDNQNTWSSERNPRDTFVEYAVTLGLDVDQFANDINDEAIRAFINENYSEGETLLRGRLATPSVFLNGMQLDGGQLGSLTATIQAELDMIAERGAMTDDEMTLDTEEVAATAAE
jgi:protein-disulfide isomerase